MPKSSSSSKQSQRSVTQGAELDTSFGIGSRGNDAAAISQLEGSRVNVTTRRDGLDAGEVVELVEAIGGGALAAVQQTAETLRPVSNIAEQATGTSSEAGRLVQQLALPVLVLAGGWLILKRR